MSSPRILSSHALKKPHGRVEALVYVHHRAHIPINKGEQRKVPNLLHERLMRFGIGNGHTAAGGEPVYEVQSTVRNPGVESILAPLENGARMFWGEISAGRRYHQVFHR